MAGATSTLPSTSVADSPTLDLSKVTTMIEAASSGNLGILQQLVAENPLYASQQDQTTGRSPLMAAAASGYGPLCTYLLQQGAPWNAIDRQGQCAGNYATNGQHWDVVNLLVDFATQAELILSAVERTKRQDGTAANTTTTNSNTSATVPLEQQPSTKPDYLRQRLQYTNNSLLDSDQDAVMMEWERPLMQAHAQILMATNDANAGITTPSATTATQQQQQQQQQESLPPTRKSVMNIGFGMGIIDTILQQHFQPSLHIIVEAHPDVYKKMIQDGWDKKNNVRILFGKWQDALVQLRRDEPKLRLDAIFYDTYGEHFLDLEDFHMNVVPNLLAKPHGVYSFFNGLAPDNLFFHGVACQCVKLQLQSCGLETEFLEGNIQVKDEVWEGIRRKYWHGRDTYYLPRVTWRPEAVGPRVIAEDSRHTKVKRGEDAEGMQGLTNSSNGDDMEIDDTTKRQRS